MKKSILLLTIIALVAGLLTQAHAKKQPVPRRNFFGAYLGESSAALLQRCEDKQIKVYGPAQVGPVSHERVQWATAQALNDNTTVNRVDFLFYQDRLEAILATPKNSGAGTYKQLNKLYKRHYGKARETVCADKVSVTYTSTFRPQFNGVTVVVVLTRRTWHSSANAHMTVLYGLFWQPAPEEDVPAAN